MRDGATFTPWVSQPRILGVALRLRWLDVDVLVAHAPAESSPKAVRAERWRALHKVASCRETQAPLILLVDANGQLGSICTESVGGIEPSAVVCNQHVLAFGPGYLAEHWRQPVPLGLCLPTASLEDDVMNCSMETELPLALVSKEDHFAVKTTVSVGGSSAPESVVSRRVPFYDRSEFRSEQCCERVTFMLEQTPCLPEDGMERQACLLEKWFRCVLASAAPRCSSKRRHKWLSEGTWNAICAGAQVLKLMFTVRRRAGLVWLGSVFNGWRGCQTRVELGRCRATWLQARFEEAFAVFLLEQHGEGYPRMAPG